MRAGFGPHEMVAKQASGLAEFGFCSAHCFAGISVAVQPEKLPEYDNQLHRQAGNNELITRQVNGESNVPSLFCGLNLVGPRREQFP